MNNIKSNAQIHAGEINTDDQTSEVKEPFLPGTSLDHEDNGQETEQDDDSCMLCSYRWIIAYIGLFYGIIIYMLRANLSVAIVSMTGSTKVNVTVLDNTNISITSSHTSYILNRNISTAVTPSEKCERFSFVTDSVDDGVAEFNWDKTTQSLILSSFFYGYIITQIPGGWVAGRYGGKHVVGISSAAISLLTILFPVSARTHVYVGIANRALMGFFMGSTPSAFIAVVSAWALPHERTRFLALFTLGTMLGAILGISSAGYLCVAGFDNGWGSVFYIHGICSIIFTLCWYLLVFDSPEKHPWIQEKEKLILCNHLHRTTKRPPVPWIHVLTSLPVWSIVVAHTSDSWLLYLLMICLPLYMDDVLNFDIESNGVFSSLPFITMAVGVLVAGVLADYILSRKWLCVTKTRKLFQTTGFLSSTVFILVCGYLTCDQRVWVIVCLCLCMFAASLGSAGYICNAVEMTPRFASVIFGISNTFTTAAGILTPFVVSAMTKNGTQEEWWSVFYLTAGILLFASVVYLVGASSDLAPWSGQVPVELEVDGPVHETELRSSSLR